MVLRGLHLNNKCTSNATEISLVHGRAQRGGHAYSALIQHFQGLCSPQLHGLVGSAPAEGVTSRALTKCHKHQWDKRSALPRASGRRAWQPQASHAYAA